MENGRPQQCHAIFQKHSPPHRAQSVAQWQSACWACVRSWVWSSMHVHACTHTHTFSLSLSLSSKAQHFLHMGSPFCSQQWCWCRSGGEKLRAGQEKSQCRRREGPRLSCHKFPASGILPPASSERFIWAGSVVTLGWGHTWMHLKKQRTQRPKPFLPTWRLPGKVGPH